MPKTRAQENRAMRQEALREQLSNQSHVQHYVANIKKIEALDVDLETFSNDLNKLRVANEHRMKLINKYLPDLKQTELTGKDGGSIELTDMTHEALDGKLQSLLDAVANPE